MCHNNFVVCFLPIRVKTCRNFSQILPYPTSFLRFPTSFYKTAFFTAKSPQREINHGQNWTPIEWLNTDRTDVMSEILHYVSARWKTPLGLWQHFREIICNGAVIIKRLLVIVTTMVSIVLTSWRKGSPGSFPWRQMNIGSIGHSLTFGNSGVHDCS